MNPSAARFVLKKCRSRVPDSDTFAERSTFQGFGLHRTYADGQHAMPRFLFNHTGFCFGDLAVGELVGQEPLLVEAFDLLQIRLDR